METVKTIRREQMIEWIDVIAKVYVYGKIFEVIISLLLLPIALYWVYSNWEYIKEMYRK